MKRAFALLACLAFFALAPARAEPAHGAIAAHPALWTVHGGTATVYLLGALHLLPPDVTWRTPRIEAAMAASGVFVFEAPTDKAGQAEASAFVAAHGLLPPGEALPRLLPKSALADYAFAIEKAGVPAQALDDKQPWLASLILQVGMMKQEHYDPGSGIDRQVFAIATARGCPVRYFETVGQQLSLIAPKDERLAIGEFVADLRQLRRQPDEIGALTDAWSHGDVRTIDRLMNGELAKEPGVKKALLDDRNAAWVARLRAMLDENHTFFVTVGAAHLAGPSGVPALLRKAGYSVDGP
ncbi:MAG: TraB/GumN family protein [Rhizomicrobium sp.]